MKKYLLYRSPVPIEAPGIDDNILLLAQSDLRLLKSHMAFISVAKCFLAYTYTSNYTEMFAG